MSPSPNAVELLTRGVRLPLAPLDHVHLLVIVEAIEAAWTSVLSEFGEVARSGIESRVNALLVTRLTVALRDRTSLFAKLVSSVHRGSEQFGFDGTKHEFRPDLNFELRKGDGAFPLVGECKILDSGGRSLRRYEREGVDRFVGGSYGWASAEALMVAYVRDGSTPADGLGARLGTPAHPWPDGSRGPHARTLHARTFRYVGRPSGEDQPGAVSIVHVWLSDGNRRDDRDESFVAPSGVDRRRGPAPIGAGSRT